MAPSSVLFCSDVGKERRTERGATQWGKRNGVNKNFFGGRHSGCVAWWDGIKYYTRVMKGRKDEEEET